MTALFEPHPLDLRRIRAITRKPEARIAWNPDGLLRATLLAGQTLTELRMALAVAESELRGGASPRIIPFATLQDVGALLQRAGFALPVVDQDRLVVRYPSALQL